MACKRLDAWEGGSGRDREETRRLQAAMLATCGEVGYGRASPVEVSRRAGLSEEVFARRFSGLRDCFTQAYSEESLELCNRILRAGADEQTWHGGLRASLIELGRYVESNGLVARALLLEVHVAGAAATACRTERIERLSRALDSARRETKSRHSPPPLTALFMVSTIEAAVASMLLRGEPHNFLKVVPELELLVSRAYFSD